MDGALLEDYDQRRISETRGKTATVQRVSLNETHRLIATMRKELDAGELFGRHCGKIYETHRHQRSRA
jgi:hypothetical protein